jgi:hypothetical protein
MSAEAEAAQWSDFLRRHPLSESHLWQYWRAESRQSEINKKVFHRFHSKILSQREVKDLIRRGIPSLHRGSVWWACSGGAEKLRAAAPQDSYLSCLERATSAPNPASSDILLDLHRTFSTEFGTPDEGNIIPLKNVLLAYSVRNKAVGYCQSMNFMAALLLMFLSEEQSFWVLAALIEDILPPEYYSRGMTGTLIDTGVFQSCLAWKLPRVFSHLRSYEISIEPIACSWFLCLFINILPLAGLLLSPPSCLSFPPVPLCCSSLSAQMCCGFGTVCSGKGTLSSSASGSPF